LRAHYQLEVGLAQRLMEAPRAQRLSGYGVVYDELFAGVPDHPQRTRLHNGDRSYLEAQLRALRPHLGEAQIFLEIGAGDCRLCFAVSRLVRRVVAVDVSDRLLDADQTPGNSRLRCPTARAFRSRPKASMSRTAISSWSTCIPTMRWSSSATSAEHSSLRAFYCCVTPNRISGPHDISVYFDSAARGLHLKEYSI
jgi:hypothetical protein